MPLQNGVDLNIHRIHEFCPPDEHLVIYSTALIRPQFPDLNLEF